MHRSDADDHRRRPARRSPPARRSGPAPRIPISSTSTSVPAGAARISSGSPISVLKFAARGDRPPVRREHRRAAGPWSRSSRSSRSRRSPGAELAAPGGREALQRAQRVVGGQHRAAAPASAAAPRRARVSTAPPGPGRQRRGGEAPAVVVLSRQADEQRPGPAARESIVDALGARGRRRRGCGQQRAPAARATRSGLQRLIARGAATPRRAAPRARRSRRRTASCAALELLSLLVALAGDHHHVARLGAGDRQRDRLAPVRPRARRPARRRPRISAMIASGSSERGLSEVTITRSASRAAISPISGRLPRSRSPPQPNTTCSRPLGQLPRGGSTFSSESGRVRVVDEHREVLALVDRSRSGRDLARALDRRRARSRAATPSARAAANAPSTL